MTKKQIAAIVAVTQYFQQLSEDRKIAWTDNRIGWTNQPRFNWTKQ